MNADNQSHSPLTPPELLEALSACTEGLATEEARQAIVARGDAESGADDVIGKNASPSLVMSLETEPSQARAAPCHFLSAFKTCSHKAVSLSGDGSLIAPPSTNLLSKPWA